MTRDNRRFALTLAAIALAGFAIRVAYVLIARDGIVFGGDAGYYHAAANLLGGGHGFIRPIDFELGHTVQAAEHPPLYVLWLAIPSALGMTSTLTHLLWSCVLGAGTVVAVGLVGRRALSTRVGIIAAVVAAISPNIWAADGALMAETATMFTVAVALFLAYRYLAVPSAARLAWVGAACGAAALTRSELILLVPALVVPLVIWSDAGDVRRRLAWLGMSVAATILVCAPWVGYNLTRFDHPVFLSSQGEITLASANCDDTYSGQLLGYYSIPCAEAIAKREHLGRVDQSEQAIVYRREALDYISHHLSRVPVVVAARLGRIVGAFRVSQELDIETLVDGREREVAVAGLVGYYLLAVLSIVGAVALHRRGRPVYPLLGPIAVVLVSVALAYANARFRAPAEISLAVLSAVALDAALTSILHRRVAT